MSCRVQKWSDDISRRSSCCPQREYLMRFQISSKVMGHHSNTVKTDILYRGNLIYHSHFMLISKIAIPRLITKYTQTTSMPLLHNKYNAMSMDMIRIFLHQVKRCRSVSQNTRFNKKGRAHIQVSPKKCTHHKGDDEMMKESNYIHIVPSEPYTESHTLFE